MSPASPQPEDELQIRQGYSPAVKDKPSLEDSFFSSFVFVGGPRWRLWRIGACGNMKMSCNLSFLSSPTGCRPGVWLAWSLRLLLWALLLSGDTGPRLQGGAHAMKAHIPGDIILGGLFPIHVKVSLRSQTSWASLDFLSLPLDEQFDAFNRRFQNRFS